MHSWRRRLLTVSSVALVLALMAYLGYLGYEGSARVAAVSAERGMKVYCFTPEMYAGWAYEAVNYDPALDATLPQDTDGDGDLEEEDCGDLRGTAGTEIVTDDGIRIAAWYIPAANGIGPHGPTILLVHGNPANKSDMLRYARHLHAEFNLLIPDLRNSGRSSGTVSTTGVLEHQEIHAVLDWLVAEKGPGHIGALGDSGGAATILMAARTDHRIEAYVTDSAHARQQEVVRHNMSAHQSPAHPPYPGIWAIETGFWLRTGHWLGEADPLDSVASLARTPYLILHGTHDTDNHPMDSAELLHAAALDAGVPARLQYCGGGTHGKLPEGCSGQYAEWVAPFFRAALAGG